MNYPRYDRMNPASLFSEDFYNKKMQVGRTEDGQRLMQGHNMRKMEIFDRMMMQYPEGMQELLRFFDEICELYEKQKHDGMQDDYYGSARGGRRSRDNMGRFTGSARAEQYNQEREDGYNSARGDYQRGRGGQEGTRVTEGSARGVPGTGRGRYSAGEYESEGENRGNY